MKVYCMQIGLQLSETATVYRKVDSLQMFIACRSSKKSTPKSEVSPYGFPTKVSAKTNEKKTVLVSGKVVCNDPTKETTIVYEFWLTVDSLQNRLQKVTPVSP